MNRIQIDTTRIKDWDSFHDVFAEAFGFPVFYGRNMNAWIDCMSSLDSPDDGMTSVHCDKGDFIVLELSNARISRVGVLSSLKPLLNAQLL